MRLGPVEIVLILIIVLVIFGPGKLSDVGAALGKGIREFRRGAAGSDELPSQENEAPSVTSETEENSNTVGPGKSAEHQGEREAT